MSSYFLIFGYGYTAQSLASKLLLQGVKVIGTTRTPHQLEHENPEVTLIDFNCPNIAEHLSLSTHILVSIPPSSTGSDLVLMNYGNLIKKHAPHLKWMGYLSSTGVYGDHQGNWVDEDSACTPHTPTGIARLKAEQAWLAYAKESQLPLHVFRLSGIYGPRRNVLERLMRGKKHSIYKEGQVFCRIHVEDIVSTLIASIKSPKPLSIYNVSDDEPTPAHIVDNYAASLLNQESLPLIPFTDATLTPMEQEFYSNNRRVSNLKIKQELHVTLNYPSFIEGLTHLWRDK
jgi:nucleoside-diphosphate-sugar epimerase